MQVLQFFLRPSIIFKDTSCFQLLISGYFRTRKSYRIKISRHFSRGNFTIYVNSRNLHSPLSIIALQYLYFLSHHITCTFIAIQYMYSYIITSHFRFISLQRMLVLSHNSVCIFLVSLQCLAFFLITVPVILCHYSTCIFTSL
jgi:hypothetical protein